MRAFYCSCGQRVFFDSNRCVSCGANLGMDPGRLDMVTWPAGENGPVVDGRAMQRCANGILHNCCNWLVPVTGQAGAPELCISCRLSEVIPSLANPDTLRLWARLELAKRQLLYNLISLGFPLHWGGHRLRFHFLEDRRRNPDVLEDFVTTGHRAGLITINVAEADDVERQAAREQMQERYRTLLGHFRHEIGHYYFAFLFVDEQSLAAFRALFGDERTNYAAALSRYYGHTGAFGDWSQEFVSSYASSHPHEDWAESFAHYLHIIDVLETALSFGLPGSADPVHDPYWLDRWSELSVALNELNRSLGMDDPYPFVLTPTVRAKLDFIHRRVAWAGDPPPNPEDGAGSRTRS